MIAKITRTARRAGIRALQSAGLFLPASKVVGNGVGRRAHLISAAAAGCRYRREYDPANDWVELVDAGVIAGEGK